jgi:hypothetical protein
VGESRIDVYFHGNGEETDIESVATTSQKKSPNTKKTARSMISAMAIDYGKKTLSYGVSVWGDLTGNYQAENGMNGAIQMIGLGVQLANFPVGTIAGVFQMTTNLASNVIQTQRANRKSEMLLKRSGNETINNSEVD